MRLLVMLQNAWGGVSMRSRKEWIDALLTSRSGLRLARAVPKYVTADDGDEPLVVDYANASPRVSWEVDGEFPADLDHVRAELERFKPTHVLACGRIAEGAVRETWTGPMLAIPHLACRVLTNALLDTARVHLQYGRLTRVALRQLRGRVRRERLQAATPSPVAHMSARKKGT